MTDVEHVVPVYAKEPHADVEGGEHLVLDRQQQPALTSCGQPSPPYLLQKMLGLSHYVSPYPSGARTSYFFHCCAQVAMCGKVVIVTFWKSWQLSFKLTEWNETCLGELVLTSLFMLCIIGWVGGL